jgi:glutaredoxin-related protein
MIDFNNTFLMSEQPTTCPKCGARTEFFSQISPVSNENVEIHKCLSNTCQFEFIVEFDENFDNEIEEEE